MNIEQVAKNGGIDGRAVEEIQAVVDRLVADGVKLQDIIIAMFLISRAAQGNIAIEGK